MLLFAIRSRPKYRSITEGETTANMGKDTMGHAIDASLDASPAGPAVLPGKMLQIVHCAARWMNPKAAKTAMDLMEAPI